MTICIEGIIAYYTYFSGKPYPPVQVLVHCGHGEAWVTWQSSYFGYEHQYSIVQFSTDNVHFVNGTHVTTEKIKQGIYQTRVYNLQDNTYYFLRVFTTNTYGFSTSSVKNCSLESTEGVYHFKPCSLQLLNTYYFCIKDMYIKTN